MKSFVKVALVAVVMILGTAGSQAMAVSNDAYEQHLQNRIDLQQQRINNGVADGSIGSPVRADVLQGRLNLAQHRVDNGHDLAAAHSLNKNSRRIFGARHN